MLDALLPLIDSATIGYIKVIMDNGVNGALFSWCDGGQFFFCDRKFNLLRSCIVVMIYQTGKQAELKD